MSIIKNKKEGGNSGGSSRGGTPNERKKKEKKRKKKKCYGGGVGATEEELVQWRWGWFSGEVGVMVWRRGCWHVEVGAGAARKLVRRSWCRLGMLEGARFYQILIQYFLSKSF